MEKDYIPSSKYTEEQLEELMIPYPLRDSCVDSFADYRGCFNTSKFNFLPFFQRFGPCR